MSVRQVITSVLLAGISAFLFTSSVTAQAARRAEGNRIFAAACSGCHSDAQSGRTPSRFSLSGLSPRAIVEALASGVMRAEGDTLTAEQREMVAEAVTGRTSQLESLPAGAFCASHGAAPLDRSDIAWMGFGGNLEGTGFQSTERAGLTAADVPQLQLRWAFAFPNASQVRTKPTVTGNTVLVGGPFGEVFALDAATGCVRWSFDADAGIRGAILLGSRDERPVAYFVDFRTSAYALDVTTGSLLWKTRVGWHPESAATGSPSLFDGMLIVPISTMEVVTAQSPSYACCTASGAVAAIDAASGDLVWYHRVIAEDAREVGRNEAGTAVLAPSGAPVWASPTIDARRRLVYVGTGENYTRPTTATSDAILAIDVDTGALAWSFQATGEDAFNMACTAPRNRQNCPSPPGPDLDFGMAPILVTRPDGKEILVVGQKSGVVWALDPDAGGAVLWSTRIGKGGALGGIHWGMATDGRYAYAANADRADAVVVDVNPERTATPGLYALDLMDGALVWSAPSPGDTCGGRPGCHAANSAAPTVIPGIVFAGGLDGWIRAHDADDGRVLWGFDTARELATVNGVPGKGGAIDGPGPVVARGMLFVNSGYGQFGQMPGNLLLAFAVNGR